MSGPTSSLKPSLHNSPFPSCFSSLRKFRPAPRTPLDTESSSSHVDHDSEGPLRVGSMGEDSAAFELGEQKISSWIYFSVVLGVVLFLLDLAWIDNSTGLGKAFIQAVSELSDSHELLDQCSSDGCAPGLYCFSCPKRFEGSRCVRSTITDQFKLLSHPHARVPQRTFSNQDDTITQQLNNGVRALMLDTYNFMRDIWLCHLFKGKCHAFPAFCFWIDRVLVSTVKHATRWSRLASSQRYGS